MRVYTPEELGPDGYPFEWHSIEHGPGIKHLVRAEAEHRCVRCGHPYEQGAGEWSLCDLLCTHGGPIRGEMDSHGQQVVEAHWRILTVHHLTMDKADCRWWNLAALCQRCHLQIQRRVQMARIYPLEHSEWFKPYAAGWYAWTYLGAELTRPEAIARLDELLALERIA
jgi:hypothetical protein